MPRLFRFYRFEVAALGSQVRFAAAKFCENFFHGAT
jgi:hypothetical protein